MPAFAAETGSTETTKTEEIVGTVKTVTEAAAIKTADSVKTGSKKAPRKTTDMPQKR